MRLADLKTEALRFVVAGSDANLARAFAVYRAISTALPSDLDARMKIADLCVTTGRRDLARRVYAAVAYYDLRAGRPLHAVVAAQALAELGESIAPLREALADLYAVGSPRIAIAAAGEIGATLAPPDPSTDLAPPTALPTSLDEAARAAADLAASTTNLTDLPDKFPPVPLLSELSPETFRRVLETVRVRRLPHGTLVVRQGERGDSFFLIAQGEVRVYARASDGGTTELARLGERAIFGELALVSARPRSASVEVHGEADLLELGSSALHAAAGELEPLAQALDRFTRERLLRNLLATSPVFTPFSPEQRLDLARRFTGHDIAPGTAIVREGDAGHGLYVVLSGEVEVVKGSGPAALQLAVLRSGDVFGEISLVRGTPATATVSAASRATVLFLAREYFDRLISALPEIRQFFEALTEERLRSTQGMLRDEDVVEADDRILV